MAGCREVARVASASLDAAQAAGEGLHLPQVPTPAGGRGDRQLMLFIVGAIVLAVFLAASLRHEEPAPLAVLVPEAPAVVTVLTPPEDTSASMPSTTRDGVM